MSQMPQRENDSAGQETSMETSHYLSHLRQSLHDPAKLVREAVATKTRIRELQNRLNMIEEQLVAYAEFKPGAKTGKLAAGRYVAKIQLKEHVAWDQEKLNKIREHVGDKMFFSLFRSRFEPVSMRDVHRALGDPDIGEALKWAMQVKPAKPYITYEEILDASETDCG